MSKLDLILKKATNYLDEDLPDESVMSFEEAKQAILKLMRETVIPKRIHDDAEYLLEYRGAWNHCIDKMLDNLKKLEG